MVIDSIVELSEAREEVSQIVGSGFDGDHPEAGYVRDRLAEMEEQSKVARRDLSHAEAEIYLLAPEDIFEQSSGWGETDLRRGPQTVMRSWQRVGGIWARNRRCACLGCSAPEDLGVGKLLRSPGSVLAARSVHGANFQYHPLNEGGRMAGKISVARVGDKYAFALRDRRGVILMRSRVYGSLDEALRDAEEVRSVTSEPGSEVALETLVPDSPGMAAESGAPVGAQKRPSGPFAVRLKFVGTPEAPMDYKSGLPLSVLDNLMSDLNELFKAASIVVAMDHSRELPQQGDYSSGLELAAPPRVRLRAGSTWLHLLTEYGTETSKVLGIVVALLKGPGALAALPGKTKAAWYNSQADATEAKERAERAAERVRLRNGLERVLAPAPEEFESLPQFPASRSGADDSAAPPGR
ncbi:hypothetical protein FHX52_3261 [Humibacillus xanthopallidus]|uniref:Uncharacterized protein n=1 Tax=Humibacillus xanthopallidus TaxID=412689 RepID=A0A543PR40_9MICO|nr:hypothetical protein [Humibacillus xanthopallidus]TQN46536.1 hypothetical protein FHX52_3261 [Humibacillus xanthopallidus]